MDPAINCFVGESSLAYCMANGARGSCSAFVNGNPRLILDLYELCVEERWEEAVMLQKKVNTWVVKVVMPFFNKYEMMDPVIDKMIQYAGGYNPPDNVYTRKPYIPVSKEVLERFKEETEQVFPEFIYTEEPI